MKSVVFKNWKARPSGLGHLMSKLTSITDKQSAELERLENKEKLTEKQAETLKDLIAKRDAPDELPEGAKSYLDGVFRHVYWRRSRILTNDYLDKGNLNEQDVLELASTLDNALYIKNDERIENGYLIGTPDNRQDIIRDAKASWDMDSFDKAELSSLYEWQIKAYCWMDDKTEGELIYGLTNNSVHQVLAARQSLWYKLGTPDDDDENWIIQGSQLERNMIFDIKKFRKEAPGYDFINEKLDFDIPWYNRVKKFDVKLKDKDIEAMKRRILLARKYLMDKEVEELKKKKLHEG